MSTSLRLVAVFLRFFMRRWGYQDIGECWDCVTETLHKPFVALTERNLSQAAMKTFSKYHQKMDS